MGKHSKFNKLWCGLFTSGGLRGAVCRMPIKCISLSSPPVQASCGVQPYSWAATDVQNFLDVCGMWMFIVVVVNSLVLIHLQSGIS